MAERPAGEGDQRLDVAIVGAGMAGISCAQKLWRAGYRVAIAEKSRGLGGRLAKRRLAQASAGPSHGDHGVRYLSPKGQMFEQLMAAAAAAAVVQPWPQQLYHWTPQQGLMAQASGALRYASAQGITALAKYLAQGLTIHCNQRVVELCPTAWGWQIKAEQGLRLQARQLVLAIPAPQAIALVAPLGQVDPACLAQLRSVQFSRCLAAIALYPAAAQGRASALPWQGIHCLEHPSLAWIGLDSSKRPQPRQPVVIVQSNAALGTAQFEAPELQRVGRQLLADAAQLTDQPWLTQPELLQVHRWGYAFAQKPLAQPFVVAHSPRLLYFAGDWCGGDRVENAVLSGLAVAEQLQRGFAS